MPEPVVISVKDVSKVYRLYDSLTEQALDVLGLAPLRFWRKLRYREHPALRNVRLEISRGERVGIVGRNGAGKSTLLKLITGNFAPTAGRIELTGKVQALMHVGLGFHPEFTGYENIQVALAYNGLQRDELARAMDEVIDFVELGDFLHQPMKTYSQGMQARIMFAAATAIRPDILIVDEILGAGDAYFSAKSALRMRRLASSGCALLLVSHSMEQVLQFCERAIWLEGGSIVMEGDTLAVVKAYEEFIDHVRSESARQNLNANQLIDSPWFRTHVLDRLLGGPTGDSEQVQSSSEVSTSVSRWAGEGGLRIRSVRLLSANGQDAQAISTGEQVRFVIEVAAEYTGTFTCRYVVLLFTQDGRPVTRHLSEAESFHLREGQSRIKVLSYPELLLGNGEYVFSVAVYRDFNPHTPQSATRYDLLSRSFAFKVRDYYSLDPSIFHHPARWSDEVAT
jgi:lipopolysaccharide transport system ATP-binding protein